MALRDEFERSGNWLFRNRSYLPLLLFVIVLPALHELDDPSRSHSRDLLWEACCFAISLAGLALRVAVVGWAAPGTSGRGTHAPVADTLNTTGLYSVVRHPLYLANYFMWLGVALFPRDWWCPVIVSLAFWLYYERIMFAEEEFLRARFGGWWLRWAAVTPAFVPAPRRWRSPERRFSARTALRREYSGLFGVVAAFTFLEIVSDSIQYGQLHVDRAWAAVFAGAAVVYIALRTLKHRIRSVSHRPHLSDHPAA